MRLADLVTRLFLALLGGLVVFDAVRLGTGGGPTGRERILPVLARPRS